MKIVINALSARKGGGQTYILNLLRHLNNDDFPFEIYLFAPDSLKIPLNPKVERVEIHWPKENPLARAFWEIFVLPRFLKKIGANILFCPGGLINTKPPEGCKAVTMFRNMIPFDPVQKAKYPWGFNRIRNWILEKAMLRSMIKAGLVIFVSEYARRLIQEKSGGRIKSSAKIYHGLGREFKTSSESRLLRPGWIPKGEYFLYVSNFDYYKNQLQVVRGFDLYLKKRKGNEKLLLVGDNKSKYGKGVIKEIEKLGLEGKVIVSGNVPYEDLPPVYSHSRLTIFASGCENCPNILLEALGAGRPVLVSDRPPMPEFGGDAVVYFNPESPEDFSDKLIAITENSSLMEDLSGRAKTRAQRFDWEECARETWKRISSV